MFCLQIYVFKKQILLFTNSNISIENTTFVSKYKNSKILLANHIFCLQILKKWNIFVHKYQTFLMNINILENIQTPTFWFANTKFLLAKIKNQKIVLQAHILFLANINV